MRPNIRLGRWCGVPVGLHYSWFVVAALITASLALQFRTDNPGWTSAIVWTTAVSASALFFIGLVLHELSHSLVARLDDIPVHGITLFALGGVAQIERDATTPGREFAIAIAGPVMSLALGAISFLIALALGWSVGTPAASPPAALFEWLGYINVGLAAFNLLPGFPLDGGRILRAALWSLLADADQATRVAAATGQVFAVVFMAIGLAALLLAGDAGGLWIAVIGWFLLHAARRNSIATRVAARHSADWGRAMPPS